MAIVEAVLQEPVFEFLNLEAMCWWEALLYCDQFNYSGLVNLAEEEMGEDDDLQEYKVHTVRSLASGRWGAETTQVGRREGVESARCPRCLWPVFSAPRLAPPPACGERQFSQAVVGPKTDFGVTAGHRRVPWRVKTGGLGGYDLEERPVSGPARLSRHP